MADNAPVALNRIERVLAYMIASTAGLAFVAIAAVFIARLAGQTDFSGAAWPAVLVLPVVALPIAFVLIIVFLVLSVGRRRRVARDGGR